MKNLINFTEWCYDNENKSAHTRHIVRENETTPVVYTIQVHINNLRATYGDDALMEVITMLGLDKQPTKKVG